MPHGALELRLEGRRKRHACLHLILASNPMGLGGLNRRSLRRLPRLTACTARPQTQSAL